MTSPEERDPYAAPSDAMPRPPRPPSDRPSDRPSERPDDPPRFTPGYGSAPPPLVPYGQAAGGRTAAGRPSVRGGARRAGRTARLPARGRGRGDVSGVLPDRDRARHCGDRAGLPGSQACGESRRDPRHCPGPAVFIGGIGLAFASGLLAFIAVFFDEFRAYQSCMGGANTEVARQECNDEFRIDIENRLG